jgi:hypothetical protein
MPESSKTNSSGKAEIPFVIMHKALSLSIVAIVILAIAGTAWWRHVYNSPRRVFEGMLRNNLSTASVTRSSLSNDQSEPVQKDEQLSFVPPISSRTLVTIDQKSAGDATKVRTESVGTLTNDYSRYLTINTSQKGTTGKPLDYQKIIGLWGRSDAASGTPQYFQQASLGIIPFANLAPETRDDVVAAMLNKKVFTVNYAAVHPKKLNHKSALVIPVTINPVAYIGVLKTIVKAGGMGNTDALRAEDYQDSQPISVNLTVDKLSRQLMEVEYASTGQKEEYSAYGLTTPTALPDRTISLDDLQQRIQEVK